MTLTFILFTISIILIVKGGDWFIDSASWIAKITGMPEVLIGATIVSLGTTLPELFVSTTAAVEGHPEISIGNAIGSIICNTGLVLGFVNLISPTNISSRIFSVKSVMLITYIMSFIIMASDGEIHSLDTAILMIALLFYILINYMEINIKNINNKNRREHIQPLDIIKNIMLLVIGSILIFSGSDMLIDNGIKIAQYFNLPKIIISLSAFALGTSLPELTTSVTAVIKGHHNMSIGNIVGANILNICLVIGVSSAVCPIPISNNTKFIHLPAAALFILILIIPAILNWKVTRRHALVLLSLYIGYIFLLFNI